MFTSVSSCLAGGDVEFHGFDLDTGIVWLRMVGACASCPSSTVTMKFNIKYVAFLHHGHDVWELHVHVLPPPSLLAPHMCLGTTCCAPRPTAPRATGTC